MPIADGDILRAVAKMSFVGNDVQNVYHIETTVSSPPNDATVLTQVIDALNTAYDYIDGFLPNDIQFETVAVWNVTQSTFVGEDDWSTLTTGGNVNDLTPFQCAPMVLFNTNVNRSQGRKFLPFLTTDSLNSDSSLDAAVLAALTSFAGYLLTGITGTGWSGVYGNWNPDLLRFVEWATATISDTMKTQRRRYIGSGS